MGNPAFYLSPYRISVDIARPEGLGQNMTSIEDTLQGGLP
jgi:hypothetical protein